MDPSYNKTSSEGTKTSTEKRKRSLKQTEEPNSKSRKSDVEKSKDNRPRKVEVTWSVPSTDGCDFGTVIKGYHTMSSTEKLKAKTKYLEGRYGAVASLEEKTRFNERLECLVDDEDLKDGITDNVCTMELTHEDAIFGNKSSAEPPPSGEDSHLLDQLTTEEVVASQKTTSWRERAAWRKQQRANQPLKKH